MVWLLIITGGLFIIGAIIGLMFYYPKSDNEGRSRVHKIQDEKYDPNQTKKAAEREYAASAARTAAATQAAAEAQAAMNLNDIHNVIDRQGELDRERHQHEMDNIALQRSLIAAAQSEGLDVESYLFTLKTRALNQAEIERIEAEANAKLRAGFVFKLKDYQHLSMLRGVLDGLYEQHYLIETTEKREPVRIRKLAQIQKDIDLHEKDADGRRKKLLSAWGGGDDNRGSDEDSELR